MLAKHRKNRIEGDAHEVLCSDCDGTGTRWFLGCGACRATGYVQAEVHPECSCDDCRKAYWFFPSDETLPAERYKSVLDAIDGSTPRAGVVSRRVNGGKWWDLFSRGVDLNA